MGTDTLPLAQQLGVLLQQRGWRVGSAESCTGGMLAAAITDVAGSSGWFDEGLVTYANYSKERLLGVPAETLAAVGAVSREVAEAMVLGVQARGADVAVATTGIAGPDGGSEAKPVGTVWFAWALPDQLASECRVFHGDRLSVRLQATQFALEKLLALIKSSND